MINNYRQLTSRFFPCGSAMLTWLVLWLACHTCQDQEAYGQTHAIPLPGTKLLELEGDIASQLVDGVDRFLLDKLKQSRQDRTEFWKSISQDQTTYPQQIEKLRRELTNLLGVRETLAADPTPFFLTSLDRSSKIGLGKGFEIHRVQWRTFGDCHGRGLMLVPTTIDGQPRKAVGQVIALPDCEITPEQLTGLSPGVKPLSQYARILAENGFLVIVPILVNRSEKLPKLSQREWLYRSAFELGRGMMAYEILEVQALIQWMAKHKTDQGKIGVMGWGEGGLLSFYAAALDRNVDATVVSGYFGSREKVWTEPIDRNTFGLLEHFGDAELLPLIAPRHLIIESSTGPQGVFEGGKGAPWVLESPDPREAEQEFTRGVTLLPKSTNPATMQFISSGNGTGDYGSTQALHAFKQALAGEIAFQISEEKVRHLEDDHSKLVAKSLEGMQAKVEELNTHSQNLLRMSHYVRQEKINSQLDYSSLEAYERSTEGLRTQFYENVIGRWDDPVLPFNPRTRLFQETDLWKGYEVVLDVYPNVIAYGLLLIPKDIKLGEKRPVVVCQHGLEGRPQDTIGEKGYAAYKAFTAKLAERGFITFAPQNLYIFTDRFRSLQRKANPLKKTLFSVITPQHQQIVDWLQTLDFVASDRIGFYGLSYGGKTAMRVPALVTDYRLSICSADFNEWVDKNASTLNPRSYTFFSEYEIFEYDLGSTFNYSEMAALIAPRPFMVERGHNDGVADDWTVAYEFAKVRNLYASKLKIPDRTTIEWFDGPHTIHGVGTFKFLHEHLDWPITQPIEPLK